MKEIKQGCDLKGCFLCKHSLPEWLQAVAVHKKKLQGQKRGSDI